MKKKHSFFKRNGLSIVLLAMMLFSLAGQFVMGHKEHNDELAEHGKNKLTSAEYFCSGHFIQATFENWESEFLQMAIYVLLTVSLYQVGSAESKSPDEKEEVDRKPVAKADSPWPVKKGGIWLKWYSSSLSQAFILLFLLTFVLHFYGSLKDHNEELGFRGIGPDNWNTYISSSKFWFESFQNWQSEFLAVASIVILTIWLRQKGSPESKPVDAPHDETGG